jgi:hypothetical protein
MSWYSKLIISASILLALLAPAVSRAGEFGFWPGYFGNMALNNRWSINGELQYRAYNFEMDLQQLLARTSVAFYPIKNNQDIQVAAGFAYVRNKPLPEEADEVPITEEQRLFQQLLIKQKFGPISIQHRYRVEERFIEQDFQMRYRYNLGATCYLNKPSQMPKALYLSAYNEVFISNQKPMFDRNRLYGGLGYCVSKALRFEAGPMWQYRENATQVQLQLMMHHNFSI